MATVTFRRREIIAHARAAAIVAIDATMAEGVRDATREHPYANRTGFLEAETKILEPAHPVGDLHVAGSWGDTADYALEVEIGTSRIGPRVQERVQEGEMWDIPGPQPEPGVTVEQPFTILPPGAMDGQESFVTLHSPSKGTGPLMEARPYLRPAADRVNPLLAAELHTAFEA
jgi:hypothetical protein